MNMAASVVNNAMLIDKNVNVLMNNSEIINGTLYTLDPLTGNAIIVEKNDAANFKLTVVMQTVVQKVYKNEDEAVSTSQLFTNADSQKSIGSSARLEQLKGWLDLNKIQFTFKNNIILLDGGAQIVSPFRIEDCQCANTIVLARTQNLLKNMPSS